MAKLWGVRFCAIRTGSPGTWDPHGRIPYLIANVIGLATWETVDIIHKGAKLWLL